MPINRFFLVEWFLPDTDGKSVVRWVKGRHFEQLLPTASDYYRKKCILAEKSPLATVELWEVEYDSVVDALNERPRKRTRLEAWHLRRPELADLDRPA